MWELMKRIWLRISSVLSMVETESAAGPSHRTGSDQKVQAPTKKYRLRLRNTAWNTTIVPKKNRDYLLPIIFNTKAVAEAAEERAKSLYCSWNS